MRDPWRAKPRADHVHAERKRQAGLTFPPRAIDDQMEPAIAVEHPAFVNQQRRVDLAGVQRVEDSSERRDRNLDADGLRRDEPQHQPRGGGGAGDADAQPRQIARRERALPGATTTGPNPRPTDAPCGNT